MIELAGCTRLGLRADDGDEVVRLYHTLGLSSSSSGVVHADGFLVSLDDRGVRWRQGRHDELRERAILNSDTGLRYLLLQLEELVKVSLDLLFVVALEAIEVAFSIGF